MATRDVRLRTICIGLGFAILATAKAAAPQGRPRPATRNSIGRALAASPNTGTLEDTRFEYRPFLSLVGEKFVFIPTEAEREANQPERVARVLELFPSAPSDAPRASLGMVADDTIVNGYAPLESIEGVASLRDIDDARKRWVGKVLWLNHARLLKYHQAKQHYVDVEAKRCAKVYVTGVSVGRHASVPVRFILRTQDGRSGFCDVNVSGTNVDELSRADNRFADSFFIINPRTAFPDWPEKVWKCIESEEVALGMSPEQVVFSWGKPEAVNRTRIPGQMTEQWVYPERGMVYFTNLKVTAIQD